MVVVATKSHGKRTARKVSDGGLEDPDAHGRLRRRRLASSQSTCCALPAATRASVSRSAASCHLGEGNSSSARLRAVQSASINLSLSARGKPIACSSKLMIVRYHGIPPDSSVPSAAPVLCWDVARGGATIRSPLQGFISFAAEKTQGVTLGWRRPRRCRAESAPYGAHYDRTAPPRCHRKKSPKGHSSMGNSLIIHTRILAKGTSGGHVSPSTGPRPGFLRPNGAEFLSRGQRPGLSGQKEHQALEGRCGRGNLLRKRSRSGVG